MSAPGVVLGAGREPPGTPGPRYETVPTTPGDSPAARSIDSTIYVVVVLPLVPVTADSSRFAAARKRLRAMTPSARRALGTTTTGPANDSSAGGSPSITSAAAPCATAFARKRRPSTDVP